ncbi:MAG: methylated-DNA--[protein]-cysteine S-methyltransferase [Thermoplasmata archaeon]|nr:methylated-DNA--[protein]-cysteine S-methyltransferase [Thermoplasmata archaeon]
MTKIIKYSIFSSRLGDIFVAATEKGICKLHFPASDIKLEDIEAYYDCKLKKDDKAFSNVKKQLLAYLDGDLKEFDVDIDFVRGTDFQKKVWNKLLEIPYGEIHTYQWMAEEVHSPLAFRAVGGANHNNPIPIIVPCHRVIGKSGAMVGYGGPSIEGQAMKRSLLEMEGALEPL